jgi:hypothetical protein
MMMPPGSPMNHTLADRHFALTIDAASGALTHLVHPDDPHAMNWVVEPGENAWAPRAHGWGLGWLAMAALGPQRWQDAVSVRVRGKRAVSTYHFPTLTVTVTRTLAAGRLREDYTFTAKRGAAVELWGIGLCVPFNDNYPDALTCVHRRCNAHLWGGGAEVWANALRMGGVGPHLGLVAHGADIGGYAVQDRGAMRGGSNIRGSLAWIQNGFTLAPGASRTLGWTLFWHDGWADFARQRAVLAQGPAIAPEHLAVVAGSAVRLHLRGPVATLAVNGAKIRATGAAPRVTLRAPGEAVVTATDAAGRTATATILVTPPVTDLLAARVRYIRERQVVSDPRSPYAGALVPYDGVRNVQAHDPQRGDCNEGRERLGMGVLLSQWARLHQDSAAAKVARRHGRFVREKLQKADFTVLDGIGSTHHRFYNYPWTVRVHLDLHRLDGRRAHLDDALATLAAYYRHDGHRFYPIGQPLVEVHAACLAAGRRADAQQVVAWAVKHADNVATNGLAFPPHEVRYEQTIVGPALDLLMQAQALSPDDRWLDAARPILAALEAFNGRQPHHRQHDIAIRHWDGWWFGGRPMWGDTFPHYWSTVTAVAFRRWWQATGDISYRDRARAILMANLSSFRADGSATCAHIFPDHVDGEPGRRDDPLANDQDWALVYLLDHAEVDPDFTASWVDTGVACPTA